MTEPRIAIVALALLVSWEAGRAQPPTSPANPLVTADAYYISAHGVTRYSRQTLAPTWTALENTFTREPVAVAGLVLVGASNGIYALEAATGDLRWHHPADATLYSPVIHGGVAYVGGEDGSLRAMILGSGRVVWQRQFQGWIYPPAIIDQTLVAGGGGFTLWGLRLDDGTTLWQRELDQELVYRPIRVANDRVVLTTFDGTVIAVSAGGSSLWKETDPVPSLSPTVAGAHLFLTGLDGVVRARDWRTGKLIWRRQVSERLLFSPGVTQTEVFVVDDTNTVSALHAASGQVLRRFKAPFPLSGNPIMVRDRFLLFSSDRRLIAVGEPGIPSYKTL